MKTPSFTFASGINSEFNYMKVTATPFFFLCITGLFVSCKSETNKKTSEPEVQIYISQAENTQADERKEFPFISKPFRTSELSFRVGGPIDRCEVYAGNYYKRGDLIAEIDPRDFRIRKERTEALYIQAKAEFERIESLYKKNNISASSYEKAKADYIYAKTNFETAVNELEDSRLIAPFNGYIADVYIEKYQDVKASQPVLTLADIDQLKIEVYVPQDIAFNSRKLQEATLQFDAIPGKSYQAKVVEISKNTTSNNLSYLLTALLSNKNGELLSGMSGKIFFHLPDIASRSFVKIPQTALCHRPTEGDYVWVVDTETNRVSKRKVESADLLPGGFVCITGGLKENETVATSGLRFLSDGTHVKLSPKKQ